MEGDKGMLNQPDITKAMQLLTDNGMADAAKQLEDSCKTVDILQQSIAYMEQLKNQLSDATAQLEKQEQLIKDQSDAIKLLREQIARNEKSVLGRLSERIDALKHGVSNVKNGLIQSASDLVLSFRMKGKAALTGAKELFHVEGKLAWIKNCVENGSYEMHKAVDKQERLMGEYQHAIDALASVNHERGKDTSFTQKIMESMRDHHTVKCGLYEKVIAGLEKMEKHLDSALEHTKEKEKEQAPKRARRDIEEELEVLDLN